MMSVYSLLITYLKPCWADFHSALFPLCEMITIVLPVIAPVVHSDSVIVYSKIHEVFDPEEYSKLSAG